MHETKHDLIDVKLLQQKGRILFARKIIQSLLYILGVMLGSDIVDQRTCFLCSIFRYSREQSCCLSQNCFWSVDYCWANIIFVGIFCRQLWTQNKNIILQVLRIENTNRNLRKCSAGQVIEDKRVLSQWTSMQYINNILPVHSVQFRLYFRH